jgi:adenylylsulfate kinase
MTAQQSGGGNLTWQDGEVSRADRAEMVGQIGATLWFTGLSGSGKSTIAVALEAELHRRGKLSYRLDGDNIRLGINKNLGFSADDRTENIRRIGEVAKLFADAGVITLSSFISPYAADRDGVRALHAAAGLPFIEVHVDCPLDEAERRDPKGLYKKARAGEIRNFTGIDDPYQAPPAAELTLRTDQLSLAEEVAAIIAYLEQIGVLIEG